MDTPNYTPKDIARFWSKVDVKSSNECWNWTSSNCRGYGTFGIKNKTYRANRIAYEFSTGINPKNLHVLHTCDNPACCNPNHLFLGTQQTNMLDMDEKGRRVNISMKGEDNPAHKLTRSKVDEIRVNYNNGGISQRKLARKFGIALSTLQGILEYKTWKD